MSENTITDLESTKKTYRTIQCDCMFQRIDETKKEGNVE